MHITSLQVTDVGPFDEVTLRFDRQVNVFIGPNNSGKSTLLWVLGELLVYPFTMPAKLFRTDQPRWSLGISSLAGGESIDGTLPARLGSLQHIFEKIGYTCFVPAQRLSTNFRSSGPTVSKGTDAFTDEQVDLFAAEWPEILNRAGRDAIKLAMQQDEAYQSNPELAKRRKLMLTGNSLVSDEAIKQKIVDLDYAAYRKNRPDIKAIVDQLASITSEITVGYPIEFTGVSEDSVGLFPQFRTPDGDLPVDVLSQGTQSIIQFLSRLLFSYAEYYDFPPDLEKQAGVLIIDEIDAHLHPTWQARIIPSLIRHFPNLQIFCSTHSPLMLAGLKTGQVQLLRRDGSGNVTVSENESDIVGWTADEILRHVMGVSNPTDVATADRVSHLQELMREEELSSADAEELELLRHTVRNDLLSGPMSAQVIKFAEELQRSRGEASPPASGSTVDQETSQK